jgi:hypothetical protein
MTLAIDWPHDPGDPGSDHPRPWPHDPGENVGRWPHVPGDRQACGEACGAFVAWSTNVAGQVLCRARCEGAPPRTTVADWEFDGDLPTLRGQLKSDFVLFSVFQEAFGVVRTIRVVSSGRR